LRRWLYIFIVLVILGLFLFVYSFRFKSKEPGETPPVSKVVENKLIIISPHWEGIRQEFTRAFKKWYKERAGVEVEIEWLDQGGTSDDLRYVKSEFSRRPEGIDIDLFFGGGKDIYLELGRLGLLLPYKIPDELLKKIPATFSGITLRDPGYRWYGAALSGFGIIYNKVILNKNSLPVPAEWEDLADERFLGWVGSGDPRSSGTARMMYEIILQAYGFEKGFDIITRVAGNVRSFRRSSSDVPKDVTLGEAAVGLAIDFYAWSEIHRVGEEKIGYALPRKLTVINPDPIAILRGAPHLELAQAFIRFVLSEQGQGLWMLPKGAPGGPEEFELLRMPVVPVMYEKYKDETSVRLNPFKWGEAFDYDSEKGARRYGILNDFLGAMVIDTHDELKEAWKAVIDAGSPEALLKELTEAPITEAELLSLADSTWSDQRVRNETIARWVKFALNKYARVKKHAEEF